jgi:hypothetical protein
MMMIISDDDNGVGFLSIKTCTSSLSLYAASDMSELIASSDCLHPSITSLNTQLNQGMMMYITIFAD